MMRLDAGEYSHEDLLHCPSGQELGGDASLLKEYDFPGSAPYAFYEI
jgi:hypothetical protein